MESISMESISWQILDKYFTENTHNLVAHHLDSYNDFFSSGINNIFKENNPIRFIARNDELLVESDKKKSKKQDNNQILLYLGGKNGDKLYFGKPIIYDESRTHYMYPNDARLRNMTYGLSIHYDVDVEIITYDDNGKENKVEETLSKIYLGNFPIMLQSNLCILNKLAPEVRFNMGECKHDFGGYFIIQGKEKVIICQEKFADNMIYIKKNKEDELYSFSADIRSVSEDASKPIRTTAVKIVAPTSVYTNNQIVVNVPNVRKPVPLFILMRALGLYSDKQIIEYCLLDLQKNESYIDLFIPSVHDATKIFNQETAIQYIATFTKRRTTTGVLDILMNYFLPHIGTDNLLDKAYFIGYMVNKIVRVFTKEDKPTDRDSFAFKRIELTGSLIYDLFREYYLIQKRNIELTIDKEYYYHTGQYSDASNFPGLILNNYNMFFKERILQTGFNKAFKGNWGAEAHTKRIGVVQDLNRLSWSNFISHLRKFNLPMDSSAKVVGPRLLNATQWGYIDPVDTPDGGNIGLHKHMAITCAVTNGYSIIPLINWLKEHVPLVMLKDSTPFFLSTLTKIIINGRWIGGLEEDPIKIVELFKLYRRNGIIPVYTSISFHSNSNEINIYTDSGRLTRPIYYIENNKISFHKMNMDDEEITWNQLVSGFLKKTVNSSVKNSIVYEPNELYPDIELTKILLEKNSAIIDYIDVAEEEVLLISPTEDAVKTNKYYTHVEIDPSLILGVMGNSIIYPENNPLARNSFSCGQSKQAVSVYNSNYQVRMDKMAVVLNYGQIPLIKSKYLNYLNKEEMPYGINAIVAIMSYTGYNVEDAILINKGALDRGLFRTTYFTMYEDREESSTVKGTMSNSKFANVQKTDATGIKPGYDYSYLDDWGLVKEGTQMHDKVVVIGKVKMNLDISSDESHFTKKGQLGYVDKSFITEGEEGFRIAKVRVCEERIPALGDKMACALPTQQVLTNVGWIEIKDVDINIHKLATLDKNGNMCYEYPINKFEYAHNGKMYYVKNKQVEVICTLNHKLYVKKRENKKGDKQYEFIEAEKVMGKMVRFKKSMNNSYPDVEYMILSDIQYKMDDWLQLLGMFIADGSTNSGAVYISALKDRKIAFNTNMLTKLGIKYKYDNINDKFIIVRGPYPEIYEHLDNLSVGALNKYLPDYVWSLSKRQSIILLDALMQGDEHTYADGFSRYGTISPKLANDVSRLAVHCGKSGVIKIASEPDGTGHMIRNSGKNKDKFHLIESNHTYYKISIITKQNEPYINKKVNDSNEEKLIDYEGKVYCVEMPSSNLYYMRENNFAPSMLIGNSRAGQKGTIGLIIDEKDMPFTAEGLKPDLIINPHAIPSRMTIGQLIESILGKSCTYYGGFGDCTAFGTKGANTEIYGSILTNAGFNSSGTQVLYDGQSGQQIQANIYIGPTYYMRLKHMVKDKINYRARGPKTMLTRQTVQGRANDGGLRIGEMERDGILAHGASAFLNDSYLTRGDEYYMAICNKSGTIAIYNPSTNVFFSPMVDGPVQFNTTLDGKMNIQNVSRFGRTFSIVKVPYSLKLMMQELLVMNIQMRIITEDNVDQLMSMSYSKSMNSLLNEDTDMDTTTLFSKYKASLASKLKINIQSIGCVQEDIEYPTFDKDVPIQKYSDESNEWVITDRPELSPAYIPDSLSPVYIPDTDSQKAYASPSPLISPLISPSISPIILPSTQINISDPELKAKWETLLDSEKELMTEIIIKRKAKKVEWTALSQDKKQLLKDIIAEQKANTETIPLSKLLEDVKESQESQDKVSILNLEEPKEPKKKEPSDEEDGSNGSTSSSKTISFS